MPKRFLNCRRVRRDLFRARLHFARDPVTGLREPDKDFYAKTAEAACAKRAEYARKIRREGEELCFGDFLKKEFLPLQLARHRDGGLSWTRYIHRVSRIKRFVLEYEPASRLCKLPLAKVVPALVERYFNDLLEDGENVTTETRYLLRQDFMQALRLAKRRLPDRVSEYFEDIEVPKIIRKNKKLFHVHEIQDRIEDEALPIESRLPVAFIYILNCRPSEMWALHWSNFNWREGTVAIEGAIVKAEHGYVYRPYTKNDEKSNRTLPLGSILTRLLRAVQKRRVKNGIALEYVFCDDQGKRFDKDRFDYVWKHIRRELGLPSGPTFYSLKTLGNSFALANGVTTAAQAKKMGHSSTRMAESAYRKVLDAETVKAVDVYERKRKAN